MAITVAIVCYFWMREPNRLLPIYLNPMMTASSLFSFITRIVSHKTCEKKKQFGGHLHPLDHVTLFSLKKKKICESWVIQRCAFNPDFIETFNQRYYLTTPFWKSSFHFSISWIMTKSSGLQMLQVRKTSSEGRKHTCFGLITIKYSMSWNDWSIFLSSTCTIIMSTIMRELQLIGKRR